MLQMLQPFERLIDRIGNALDRHEAGAALDPPDRIGREKLRARRCCDAARELEPVPPQARARQHQRRRFALAQDLGRALDRVLRRQRRRRHGDGRGRAAAFVPRGVGGQNEGRDLARRRPRRRHRLGAVRRHGHGIGRGAQPFRIGARHALDVGVERRIVLLVICGVVADHVDDRRARAARVVQVGEPVAEARRQVQQRRGRLARHAAIAVGGAGDDALEEGEDAAYRRHAVERRHEMHLGRAGIGEAGIDAALDQRAREAFGSVHVLSPQLPPAML